MSSKKLRTGFTTGAAAAASVKAALLTLLGKQPQTVDIQFLNDERKEIKIKSSEKISDYSAQATVIKDV